MVNQEQCAGCRYRLRSWDLGPHCGYMQITGKSRLAAMSREDRESGRCPVKATGKSRVPGPVRPRVHKYDQIIRLERRGRDADQ